MGAQMMLAQDLAAPPHGESKKSPFLAQPGLIGYAIHFITRAQDPILELGLVRGHVATSVQKL